MIRREHPQTNEQEITEDNFDRQETLDYLFKLSQNFKEPGMLKEFLRDHLKSKGLQHGSEDIDIKMTCLKNEIPILIKDLIKNEYGQGSVESIPEIKIKGSPITDGKYIKFILEIEYRLDYKQKENEYNSISYQRIYSKMKRYNENNNRKS